MKKLSVITVGAVLLAAVPATMGLTGNASFAQSVPVRVPSQAVVVEDRAAAGTHLEVGDDLGIHRATRTTVTGDDKGGLSKHVEAGNDKVADGGSGKDDNGGHGVVHSGKGGKDDGSGHS